MQISGSRREVGRALGEHARPVLAEYWAQSPTWRALQVWRGHPHVDALARCAREALPAIWAELEGLAEGLGQPFDDVFLWHCRGDLLSTTDDGCTTVALRGADGTRWIGHNEDGDPWLRGRCSMVEAMPEGAPGLVSFCYPGSLPGHAFGMNRRGLVQTINNLRLVGLHVGVPRMLLARAVLDCATLEDAVDLLRDVPRAGAFHHTLGAAGDPRVWSVEVAPSIVSAEEIRAPFGHANHAVHVALDAVRQRITDSSRARQNRLACLLPDAAAGEAGVRAILRDAEGAFPIHRNDPADTDGENTLATGVFGLGGAEVSLRVFAGGGEPAGFRVAPEPENGSRRRDSTSV